jgi:arginyl-tRNA synthetase
MKLFHLTRQWSLDGFDKIQKELGVHHDKVFFESDIKAKGQKVVLYRVAVPISRSV